MICQIVKPRKLYLVDPWTKSGETFGWGKEYTNFDTLTTAAAMAETRARVERFPDTETVLIEDIYPTCAEQIKEPLDWAYLDASHKYNRTLNELWHLNGQAGAHGIILGDDWHINPKHQHHGVFLAVHEFLDKSDWELIAAGRGNQWAIKRSQ